MKCGSGSSQFISKQRRNKHSWRCIKRANSCSEVLMHVYCCLFRSKCFEEVTALSARPSKIPADFGTVTKRPDLSVSKWFSLSFWVLFWPGLVTFRSGAKSWLLVFIKKYMDWKGILRIGSVAAQWTTYFSACTGSNECHDWQKWSDVLCWLFVLCFDIASK